MVEVLVNLQAYAESLVLRGDVDVAARAGQLILDHPPVAASSRAALAVRFPEQQERGAA